MMKLKIKKAAPKRLVMAEHGQIQNDEIKKKSSAETEIR